MSLLTKEQLKSFISENNIQSIPDLYTSLKNLFKDTIQEMLEAELSTELGYKRYEKKDKDIQNSRNGYTQKTVKTQFGEMKIDISRDRQGEFEPKIIPKYKMVISGIEEKSNSSICKRHVNKRFREWKNILCI